MTEPPRTDLVFLSEGFDLKSIYGGAFARHAPWLTLLNPDEVANPGAICFAMAYDPAGDAFERFANLDLVCAWGAGVDGLLLHPGLPPDLAPHIFEPFVSGRENGTGLGLALVSKLMSDVGGWIGVESTPGRTVFRISLPVAPKEAPYQSGED